MRKPNDTDNYDPVDGVALKVTGRLVYLFFETIPQCDVEDPIVGLSKGMMWLCPRPYISHQQRSRMLDFKDRAAVLFEKYHFRTASGAECQYTPDGEHPHVPAYMFALEKKENSEHPRQTAASQIGELLLIRKHCMRQHPPFHNLLGVAGPLQGPGLSCIYPEKKSHLYIPRHVHS